MNLKGYHSTIIGMGLGVPDRVLTNNDLEKMVDTSDDWITARTGIRERRIASPDQATSDIAEIACRKALEQAGMEPDDVEAIILCTVSPDHFVPPGACTLQSRLGASKAIAFDINAACSGFLYGLAAANGLISTGGVSRILLVGAETLSRITNYQDRNTCILFGDGAGAAVIVPSRGEEGILSYNLGSDGTGAELIMVPAGGSRIPTTHETVENRLHFIQMKGNEVFKQAVRAMVKSIDQSLEEAGLTRSDIDWVVPHQANLRIIEAAASRLEVPKERLIVNIDRYGNTSAASIPIALTEAVQKGLLKEGQIVALVGFGAGLSWGSAIIRW